MSQHGGLSLDERRWLYLLAEGKTVEAVAAAEGYSPRHMRRLLAKLYQRLGATKRIPALVAAAKLGLLDDEVPAQNDGGGSPDPIR